jgi:hypothetical protein
MRSATMPRLRRRHRHGSPRAPRLVELAPTTPAAEAARRMQAAGQSLALLTRGNGVVGVVDLEDLRFARDWLGEGATVADATTMWVTERPTEVTERDVRPY